MKRIKIRKSIGKWLVVASAATCLLCSSCGGGFGADSENASQYQHALFGTDTLETGSAYIYIEQH